MSLFHTFCRCPVSGVKNVSLDHSDAMRGGFRHAGVDVPVEVKGGLLHDGEDDRTDLTSYAQDRTISSCFVPFTAPLFPDRVDGESARHSHDL
jgi:hypothetical protein